MGKLLLLYMLLTFLSWAVLGCWALETVASFQEAKVALKPKPEVNPNEEPEKRRMKDPWF